MLEVSERVAADGEVLAPLDLERVRDHLRALITGHQLDAIAIALLWSLRNPAHEEQLRELAAGNGHRNVIATDMGGTSFEVGLIIDGQPLLSSEQVVEQFSF
ncbi:MAG: hypothetical protein JOY78_17040, partial [Pseudonocardia sp.]|nr:hypothetical protein [Pseudonocardia sp.]